MDFSTPKALKYQSLRKISSSYNKEIERSKTPRKNKNNNSKINVIHLAQYAKDQYQMDIDHKPAFISKKIQMFDTLLQVLYQYI